MNKIDRLAKALLLGYGCLKCKRGILHNNKLICILDNKPTENYQICKNFVLNKGTRKKLNEH